MKHLTVDEMIDFVSFQTLDQKSLDNAARVTGHIRQCQACLRKVHAFQVMYDEMERMGRSAEFHTVNAQDTFPEGK